jgi:hypothetical protein
MTDPIKALADSRKSMLNGSMSAEGRLRSIAHVTKDFLNSTKEHEPLVEELLETILWRATSGNEGRDYRLVPPDSELPASVSIKYPTAGEVAALRALGIRNRARENGS